MTPDLRNPEGSWGWGRASGAPLALKLCGVADVKCAGFRPAGRKPARDSSPFCFGASFAAASSCSSARQTCSCSDRALRRGRSATGEAAAGAAAAFGAAGGNPCACVSTLPFPAGLTDCVCGRGCPRRARRYLDGSRLDRQQTPPFVSGEPTGLGGRGGGEQGRQPW